MAHTPGPWAVRWHNGLRTAIIEAGGERLACNIKNSDADLMAAAPDLLAALRELVHYDDGSSEPGAYGYEVLQRCKAVIAKAEGRES